MHIIIGAITALAGLIWALHSLQNAGFDLNALNPFAWLRRRKWQKQLGVKPMHNLTNSMEAAALLTVAIAKTTGDITRDSKIELLALFEAEFGIKRGQAIELFSTSTYMLKDTMAIAPEVKHIIAPSKDEFNESHIVKLLSMLQKAASLEGEPLPEQQTIIDTIKNEFEIEKNQPTQW